MAFFNGQENHTRFLGKLWAAKSRGISKYGGKHVNQEY